MRLAFRVNGDGTSLDVLPSTLLSSLLRERFGQALEECAGSDCGRCAVLIDGTPTRSCMRLAVQCERRDIRFHAETAASADAPPKSSLRNEAVKPVPFRYAAPEALAKAVDMLADCGPGRVAILAGGLGLIPRLKLHVEQPELVVDLRKLDGLRMITASDESMVLGACTTHGQLGSSRVVALLGGAMLRDVARAVDDPTARQVGTLGGSIVRRQPVTGWHAALWAAAAEVVFVGPNGERRVSADDFFPGLPGARKRFGEVLTAIHVPTVAPAVDRSFYVAEGSIGVAAQLRVEHGRIDGVAVVVHGLGNGLFRARGLEAVLRGASASSAVVSAAQVGLSGPGMPAVGRGDSAVAVQLFAQALERALGKS